MSDDAVKWICWTAMVIALLVCATVAEIHGVL